MQFSFAYKRTAFALFAAALAGCAGTGAGTATTPSTGIAVSGGSPAVERASGLHYQVFTAGQTPGFPSTADAADIAAGPNQTIWFTDDSTPAIGRIASDGTITEFSSGLPPGAEPNVIMAGPDGNMWFSDYRGAVIGKITPDGTITEYSPNKPFDTHAKGITFGSDGQPWVVAIGIQPMLAHLGKRGGISVQPLAKFFTPDGSLATDAAGNIWFTGIDKHVHGQLLERVASTGKIVRRPMHMQKQFLPCCPNTASKTMTIAMGGTPWFTTMPYLRGDKHSFQIGTVVNNKVRLYRLTHNGDTGNGYPSGIAFNGKGLWIAGNDPLQFTGSLFRFDGKGHQAVYAVPYGPRSLANDASGNPWFTSHFGGEPSQIVEVLGTNTH
ncbi:MAG TPA: hypothetical protein VGF18_07990 [Candidatus Tumulicola sp.]